jgi:hypothetical protein
MASTKTIFFIITVVILYSIFMSWFLFNDPTSDVSNSLISEIDNYKLKSVDRATEMDSGGIWTKITGTFGAFFDTVVLIYDAVISVFISLFSGGALFTSLIVLSLFTLGLVFIFLDYILPMIRGN